MQIIEIMQKRKIVLTVKLVNSHIDYFLLFTGEYNSGRSGVLDRMVNILVVRIFFNTTCDNKQFNIILFYLKPPHGIDFTFLQT